MGLDVSHDCWRGSYSNFNKWRQALAIAAGLPPLELMEGFYRAPVHPDVGMPGLPIKWECLKPDPIITLLNHSDCDGIIKFEDLAPLRSRLLELTSLMPTEYDKERCLAFSDGLHQALLEASDVEFQ